MKKEELIPLIENEVKARLESLLSGTATITTYSDIESAPSTNGLNVKGDGWEIEINIFSKA